MSAPISFSHSARVGARVKPSVDQPFVLERAFVHHQCAAKRHLRGDKPDEGLGAWGDSFGALNVVVSTLAFVGILITLLFQGRGLEDQAADQHRQRCDASFFELLRLQREARRDLIFFNTPEFEAERAARSYQTFSLATTGRLPPNGPIDSIAAAVLEVHFQLIRKGILGRCSRNEVVNDLHLLRAQRERGDNRTLFQNHLFDLGSPSSRSDPDPVRENSLCEPCQRAAFER